MAVGKEQKKINILLLSMSLLAQNLKEYSYFASEDNGAEYSFCGVSQLEAGTKYFLRKLQRNEERLDKIFVIESSKVREEDQKRDVSVWLTDGADKPLTATEFYQRRIIQYIQNKEKCYSKSEEEQSELAQKESEWNNRDLVALYPEPEQLFEIIEEKDTIYHCVNNLCNSIKGYADGCGEVNLYLDMQGARRYETFIINAAVKMLEIRGVFVKGSVAVDFAEDKKTNTIVDTIDNIMIFEMVAGMNEFIRTGRGDTLLDFWEKYSSLPKIGGGSKEKEIIAQIGEISKVISLCDVEKFDSNLQELKRSIDVYVASDDEGKQPLFQAFVSDLQTDYFGQAHDLLPDKVPLTSVNMKRSKKMINQIKWCIDKKLLQQALALVDEKIPADMVENRVLYYKDQNQLRELLHRLMVNQWHPLGYLQESVKNGNIWINTNYVLPGKESLVFIKYVLWPETKKKPKKVLIKGGKSGPGKYIDLVTEYRSLSGYESEIEKLAILLRKYQNLADQRNKVMHATGDNVDADKMTEMLLEFVELYEDALQSVSYDYSLERPLKKKSKVQIVISS